MTWERAGKGVDELLARSKLEEATASQALADRLVREADKHPTAAGQIVAIDEAGACQLAYDAARKPEQRCSPSKACARRPGVAMWLSRTRSRLSSWEGRHGCLRAYPSDAAQTVRQRVPGHGTPHDDNRRGPGGDIESASGILAAAKGLLASGNVHPFR